jgi:hypothetical protein
MDILLVSAAFFPEVSPRSFRATELAFELVKKGHNVTVFTVNRDFDYTNFATDGGFKVENFGSLNYLKPIGIFKSFPGLKIINRIIVRLAIMLFEFPSIKLINPVVKKLLSTTKTYDLMISFAVPHPIHWGCAWALKRKPSIAKIWVADCGDPYYGDRLDSFRKLFYFAWVEKFAFRRANYISITRDEFKQHYFKEFHAKMIVIPQGFNFDKPKLDLREPANPIPKFAFAGTLGGISRSPDHILEALNNMNADYEFYFFTSSKDQLESSLNKFENLKNKVTICEPVAREKLLNELVKMDFLVNLEFNPNNQSPSKLIDYALTKRPILNYTQASKNQDLEVLRQFLNKDYTNKFVVEDLNQFDIRNVAQKFVSLINGK